MTDSDRLQSLERRLSELEDREAIREVIHRYCHAADRCDLELFKSCYHEDGYDDHGFFAGNAHEFCDYVIPVLKQIDSSMHAITNTRIELEGSRASCASQWSVIHRLRAATGQFLDFWHQGRYLDVFEKRDGEWKILHRVIASDFDRWFQVVDIIGARDAGNAALRGQRGRGDPGYLGFDLLKHKPNRPTVPDLWGPFKQLGTVS
jgi:SnoaL-like domain